MFCKYFIDQKSYKSLVYSPLHKSVNSVATAIADVFQINCLFGTNELHKILRIFEDIAEPKDRGVI